MQSAASSVNQGEYLDTNVDDGYYTYIDADVVVPNDGHQYEELRRFPQPSGLTRPDPNSSGIREQPTPVQPAAPAGGGTQNNNNCCRRPPCWGWAVLIIGLVTMATLIALLVFFLKSSSSPVNLPATSDVPTVTDPSTVRTTPTPTVLTNMSRPTSMTPSPPSSSPVTLPATSNVPTVTDPSTVRTTPTPTVPASMSRPTSMTPSPRAKNCQDIYITGGTISGVYSIYPNGTNVLRVYCEQTIAGGGWTVFQRRIDGSVDFYRGWADYKQGFGEPSGEYWLGNANLHMLTANQDTQLLVELEYGGETLYASYTEFWVLSEVLNYELHVASYTGGSPPGDSLDYHNGRSFTTRDRDTNNCASGGWWYGSCHTSNLNGHYNSNGFGTGINWYHWKGWYTSLSATRMMVKPR